MQRIRDAIEPTEDPETIFGQGLNKFSRPMVRELIALATSSSYPANVVLFAEKDESRGIYLLLEGEIKLSINSRDGRRLSLRIAHKGEILGLVSALTGGAYELTAETLYPARVAAINRRHFLNFLARHPEAYHALSDELTRDFTMACEQLRTVVLSSSAPKKLARLLLEWSENGQIVDQGTKVRFSMTHEEIGEFIGTSRETVTRILNSFKSKQLVALHGSTLTIPDKAALAEYAGC
jgi:CRP/FNR family cyclic AMP-dependent transcriptional regulator